VRAELLRALRRVGITHILSTDLIFPEEDEQFSATLQAIRKAHALRAAKLSAPPAAAAIAGDYYLI
jgi:SulP family sulfate permease